MENVTVSNGKLKIRIFDNSFGGYWRLASLMVWLHDQVWISAHDIWEPKKLWDVRPVAQRWRKEGGGGRRAGLRAIYRHSEVIFSKPCFSVNIFAFFFGDSDIPPSLKSRLVHDYIFSLSVHVFVVGQMRGLHYQQISHHYISFIAGHATSAWKNSNKDQWEWGKLRMNWIENAHDSFVHCSWSRFVYLCEKFHTDEYYTICVCFNSSSSVSFHLFNFFFFSM